MKQHLLALFRLLGATMLLLVGGCGGSSGADAAQSDPMCVAGTVALTKKNDGQTAAAGSFLALQPAVSATCLGPLSPNPIVPLTDGQIRWVVVSGGGTVDTRPEVLNDLGSTFGVVRWRLGSTVGVQSIEARYERAGNIVATAAFSATALANSSPCNGGQGTGYGTGTTFSTDAVLTKAGSPHFTMPNYDDTRKGALVVNQGATLTIEPGAVVCVDLILVKEGGRLLAQGTDSEPVRFSTDNLGEFWHGFIFGSGNTTSVLDKVIVDNAIRVDASEDGQVVIIRDALFARLAALGALPDPENCVQLRFHARKVAGVGESVMSRTVIDGYGGRNSGCAALSVSSNDANGPVSVGARVLNSAGTGIEVYTFATDSSRAPVLTECEVSGSALHGVVVSGTSASTIVNCNLSGNAGSAVYSQLQGAAVIAHDNWWGDPAGPTGPGGDGILGDVLWQPPKPVAIVLDY